jgi:MoaA/NifB/PqqE/SkfB family radical SAM enzyme
MCGNLGDPIVAKDTLEIFQFLRKVNPSIRLSMHTNGSARDKEWWKKLAKVGVAVTFGIDGLEDTHHLYRIGTDWKKILENAKAFIDAGGEAYWHMLVFKHNEHQVEQCRKISQAYGFKNFSMKHTSRFKEDKFHVIDDTGKTLYKIYPTDLSKSMIEKVNKSIIEIKPIIKCKAKTQEQIYVSATGNVSPCCWLDMEYKLAIQDTRIDFMDKVAQFPNLNKITLEEIFNSNFFRKIESTWEDDSLLECSKQCGSFDKLKEQFVED